MRNVLTLLAVLAVMIGASLVVSRYPPRNSPGDRSKRERVVLGIVGGIVGAVLLTVLILYVLPLLLETLR